MLVRKHLYWILGLAVASNQVAVGSAFAPTSSMNQNPSSSTSCSSRSSSSSRSRSSTTGACCIVLHAVAVQQHPRRRRQTLTELRRLLFGGTATAVVTAAAATATSAVTPTPTPAITPMPITNIHADAFAMAQAAPTNGKIIEFELANVVRVGTTMMTSSQQQQEQPQQFFHTGRVRIQLRPEWAPRGVARVEELVKDQFWNNCRFFRVLPGCMAQFGISGNPTKQAQWRSQCIMDDLVPPPNCGVSNQRGTVSFATAGGPHTRTTQLFINTRVQGNAFLDEHHVPIGYVVEGMEYIDQCYSEYGESDPLGQGPSPGLIQQYGNEYLRRQFPKLSFIKTAKFVGKKKDDDNDNDAVIQRTTSRPRKQLVEELTLALLSLQ